MSIPTHRRWATLNASSVAAERPATTDSPRAQTVAANSGILLCPENNGLDWLRTVGFDSSCQPIDDNDRRRAHNPKGHK